MKPTSGLTWILVALLVGLEGCGQGTPVSSPTPGSSPTSADPLASPRLTGRFVVDPSGRKLAMNCWGKGDPTVFLETGGGALEEFTGAPIVRRVAAKKRVCLYNRAGTPPSDPAPNRPREAEDVAADFHALTEAAGIDPPFVLFGRSFGGMVVTFYASKYSHDVAGVVVFDSPAPSASMTRSQFPEGVWNYPENVEHLNVLTGYENRFGRTPVHFNSRLIVISPSAGEGTPRDERYWLQTSPHATQVVLQGGVGVINSEADRISEEILSLA
jgi:pimeloyl-ACP methyl ester carboxylesterase